METKNPNGYSIRENTISTKNALCKVVGVPPNMRAISPLFFFFIHIKHLGSLFSIIFQSLFQFLYSRHGRFEIFREEL